MQIHVRRLTAFAAVAVGLMAQASPASAALPNRETVAASSVSNSVDKGVGRTPFFDPPAVRAGGCRAGTVSAAADRSLAAR